MLRTGDCCIKLYTLNCRINHWLCMKNFAWQLISRRQLLNCSLSFFMKKSPLLIPFVGLSLDFFSQHVNQLVYLIQNFARLSTRLICLSLIICLSLDTEFDNRPINQRGRFPRKKLTLLTFPQLSHTIILNTLLHTSQ